MIRVEHEYRPRAEGFSRVFEPGRIRELLAKPVPSEEEVRAFLQQEQFSLTDFSRLMLSFNDPISREIIFATAVEKRMKISGGELYRMPPVYVANGQERTQGCNDSCLYCPFHRGAVNSDELVYLSPNETFLEVKFLMDMGYGDVELVAATVDRLLHADIAEQYVNAAKKAGAKNVGINFMPLGRVEDYRKLANAGLDFTIVWQETYDRMRYQEVHPAATPKANMDYRLDAHDRALQGGVSTVGLAFLGGISDWSFDALATISHAQYLQKKYDAHIIFGMPRFKTSEGLSDFVPTEYTDEQYKFVGALFTLAGGLPWFSTREEFNLSEQAAKGGAVLWTDTCSTAPGGYFVKAGIGKSQFPVYSRSFEDGTDSLIEKGFRPQIHLPGSWPHAT